MGKRTPKTSYRGMETRLLSLVRLLFLSLDWLSRFCLKPSGSLHHSCVDSQSIINVQRITGRNAKFRGSLIVKVRVYPEFKLCVLETRL
jgi:hypothetical protein